MRRSLASAIPPVEPPKFLREAAASYGGGPSAREQVPLESALPERAAPLEEASASEVVSYKEETSPAGGNPQKGKQLEFFEEKLLSSQAREQYRFIGQLFETYWLIQYRDEFLIIDQHAAHEKVLYERLVKELARKQIYGQMVSPPILLTLNMREEEILKRFGDFFSRMGFEIRPFGGKEYAVSAVPANLYGIAQKDLLLELLDGLSEELSRAPGEWILEKLASMSCKAAVKGGDRLSFAEAEALIDELLMLDNPYACPHGRPTIVSMNKRELEKKFKRIV